MEISSLLRDDECLDKHHPTCSNDSQEGDNIHYADGIKYDKAWASQRSIEERHVVERRLKRVRKK